MTSLSEQLSLTKISEFNWRTQAQYWEAKANELILTLQAFEKSRAQDVHALAKTLASNRSWSPLD